MLATLMELAQATNGYRSQSVPIGYYFGAPLLGGMIGAFIGMFKGRTVLGFILGALLGCIGWIIVGVMSRKRTTSY